MTRNRLASVLSCSANAVAAANAARVARARAPRTFAESLFRSTGKPRAIQSFMPPLSGTTSSQPADRRMPVARLARTPPFSEITQTGCLIARSFRKICGAASSGNGKQRAPEMWIELNSARDRMSIRWIDSRRRTTCFKSEWLMLMFGHRFP